MDSDFNHSGELYAESETNLQLDSSTLGGLGPASLTPSLDLLMILIPACRSTVRLPDMVQAIETHVEPPFGVIVVIDSADSQTRVVVDELSRDRPWLDAIPNTLGTGIASALRCGFRAIGTGPVAVMSCDGSDNPLDLGRMRRLYAEGHFIVAASREMRGGRRDGNSRLGRLAGSLLNRLLAGSGGLPLTDPTHSFRLYDAAIVNELQIDSQSAIDVPVELAIKAASHGISIVEVPTRWRDPDSGSRLFGTVRNAVRWLRWCRRADWSDRRPSQLTSHPHSVKSQDPHSTTESD